MDYLTFKNPKKQQFVEIMRNKIIEKKVEKELLLAQKEIKLWSKKKSTAPRKLSKEQVLGIPRLLVELKSIHNVAEKYNVSWTCIWYWIGKLRADGIKVTTNKKGRAPLFEGKIKKQGYENI